MAAEPNLALASPSLLLAARLTGNGITGFWNCNARIAAAHNGEFTCYSLRCRMIGKRNASPRRLAAVANRPAAYAPQKGSRGRSPGSEWRRSRVYLASPGGAADPPRTSPAPKAFGAGFWRRPIDSFAPAHSPATLAGLTVYPAASRHGVFSARVGVPEMQKPHWDKPSGVFILATSYSRTTFRRTTIGAAAFHCRVRNGNGWCHCAMITRGPSRTGGFAASQRRKRGAASLVTMSIFQRATDSLISTYRAFENAT